MKKIENCTLYTYLGGKSKKITPLAITSDIHSIKEDDYNVRIINKVPHWVEAKEIKTWKSFMKYAKYVDLFIRLKNNKKIKNVDIHNLLGMMGEFLRYFPFLVDDELTCHKNVASTISNPHIMFLTAAADSNEIFKLLNNSTIPYHILDPIPQKSEHHNFGVNPKLVVLLYNKKDFLVLKIPKTAKMFTEVFDMYGLDADFSLYKPFGESILENYIAYMKNLKEREDIRTEFFNLKMQNTPLFKRLKKYFDRHLDKSFYMEIF